MVEGRASLSQSHDYLREGLRVHVSLLEESRLGFQVQTRLLCMAAAAAAAAGSPTQDRGRTW